MAIALTSIIALLTSAFTVSGVSFFAVNGLVIGMVLLMMRRSYTLATVWVLVGGTLHDLYTPGFFGAELLALSGVALAIYALTTHYDQERSVHNMVLSIVAGISYYALLSIVSVVNQNPSTKAIESISADIVSATGMLVVALFISMILMRIVFTFLRGRPRRYVG